MAAFREPFFMKPDMETLKKLIHSHDKVAFLIGNGPNLAAKIMPSWKELLASVSDMPISSDISGLSNTEVYDLVELHSKNPTKIKERVCQHLTIKDKHSLTIHKDLMEMAEAFDIPVLTTNFDQALETSVDAKLHHLESKSFTRFYPWKSYYGHVPLEFPTDGFGIWKIHGDIRYKDSIRLGLTEYMGSVERARKILHKGKGRLMKRKDRNKWQGNKTWLHIWFHLPIIIFGLGCGIDEIFLRWLLIERRRYLNLYKEPMNVWYISLESPPPAVSNLMQNLGAKIEIIKDYPEIYGKTGTID